VSLFFLVLRLLECAIAFVLFVFVCVCVLCVSVAIELLPGQAFFTEIDACFRCIIVLALCSRI
jgi:hypothetical protein